MRTIGTEFIVRGNKAEKQSGKYSTVLWSCQYNQSSVCVSSACVCVCARARASVCAYTRPCVRACVCVCVRARACVRVCLWGEGGGADGPVPINFFMPSMFGRRAQPIEIKFGVKIPWDMRVNAD